MATGRFRSDTAKLKEWLLKRKTALEQARVPFEEKWREIRRYFEPDLGKALVNTSDINQAASERDDAEIINSEPRVLVQRLSAGLQSGVTNQARDWFRLKSKHAKVNRPSEERGWLDFATETCKTILSRSNAYAALDLIYKHFGQFGSSCSIVVYDDVTWMHVDVCDEGAYWLAQNRRGRVDTVLRILQMTGSQLVEEFGKDALPERVRMQLDTQKNLEALSDVFQMVCPRWHVADLVGEDVAEEREFASIYWMTEDDRNDGILDIRTFGYNPILAPRWGLYGSVYGIGPGHIGLPDNKELQTLELDKLKMIEQEADPSMLAGAGMKGVPINTGPGGVTYFEGDLATMTGRGLPVQRLYQQSPQIEPLLLAINDVTERLRKIFYSDLFAMMLGLQDSNKQRTATEINELSAEKVALLGPVLTRLNVDLLNPLVDAVFAIAVEAAEAEAAEGFEPDGEFSLLRPPESLRGQELNVEYVSSLHIEQLAASRLSGLGRLIEFTGMVGQLKPSAADKINSDKMIDVAAESLVEHGCVYSEEEVMQIREQRAAAEREAQQMEAMMTAARTAKDFAAADEAQSHAAANEQQMEAMI